MGKKNNSLPKKAKSAVNAFAKKHFWFSSLVAKVGYPHYRNQNKLNRAIKNFTDPKKLSPKDLRKLRETLYANRLCYQINCDEYFLLHFEEMDDAGKRKFVGDNERNDLLNGIGTKESHNIFDDKYQTYLHFKPFYKREIIKVASEDSRDAFDDFIAKHDDVIVKPLKKSFGIGVYRLNTSAPGFCADAEFRRIRDYGECILEETIHQCAETAKFHPASVNSLRFAAFLQKDRVLPLFGFFRMGRGDSVVDNAGSGGILAAVDMETGLLSSPGVDERGNHYLVHPDSCEKIIGFQLPRWDEAVSMVEKMAHVVPEQRYIAWDLALTNDGWVVVEGNRRGQFLQQYATLEGCRETVLPLYQKSNS